MQRYSSCNIYILHNEFIKPFDMALINQHYVYIVITDYYAIVQSGTYIHSYTQE